MKRLVCLIVALGWLCCVVSHAKQLDKKQGKFLSMEDPLKNGERKLISSSKSPSELSCSQKCLHHEKCKYKKFERKTEQCELLQSIAREDFQAKQKITKKETIQSESFSKCKLMPGNECGEHCIKKSRDSQVSTCDCRGQGVYTSCSAALSANCFRQAVYWIFPKTIPHLMEIPCMQDARNRSVAVFHHDSEAVYVVRGYEDPGSYRRNFSYHINIKIIERFIDQSSYCQQHTNLTCYSAERRWIGKDIDYSFISGRDGRQLAYWGGGPSNGTGCACGINNTCALPAEKCNCDRNDNEWRTDEGLVTKTEDLPIMAVSAGDTGDQPREKLKYTVGPLKCVF